MNKNTLQILLKIKKKYASTASKNEYTLKRASNYLNSGKIKWLYGCALLIKSSSADMAMYRRIKRKLVSAGLYREDEIALELNEFLKMGNKAKAIIGPIEYSAVIKTEYLENVELIWSDASFLALSHASHINSLKYAMGNLLLGDLDSPINLELTGGNAYLERVTDFSMLPKYTVALNDVHVAKYSNKVQLQNVLGNICVHSDEEFSKDDFVNLERLDGSIHFQKTDRSVPGSEIFNETSS